MGKDPVLELEARRRIYQALSEEPGLHLRALARRLEMPLSTLRYHVRYLAERDILTVRRDGQYKRYFPTRDLSAHDKEILSVLRREKPRRILIELLAHGGDAGYAALRDALAYPSSTLGLYLRELVERGVIERETTGRTSRYEIRDEDRFTRLLIEYRESFYDPWVDRILEIVEETAAEIQADQPPGKEDDG